MYAPCTLHVHSISMVYGIFGRSLYILCVSTMRRHWRAPRPPERSIPHFLVCRKRWFLFVSREEGFGFPLLQALHCGTPTVISKADVLREIAGETYPYAETENHQQMTSILSRYLTDDSYWHKISQKSLVAASPFTWEESIQSHIRAYRELIK